MPIDEQLRGAGFDEKEISNFILKQTNTLKEGGFTQDEIDHHFGFKKTPSVLKTIGKQVGDTILGTAETAMAVSSSALLFPFSKAYGTMALPWGEPAARMAEESIMSRAYQPYTKSGQAATQLIGKGVETFLAPARYAKEKLEPVSPRLAYLGEAATEFAEFGMLPLVKAKVKAGVSKIKSVTQSTKEGLKVMEFIRERRANIDKAFLDSELFIRNLENTISRPELDAIPFIREGIKDPQILKKIGREDLIPLVENPTPKMLEATNRIGRYYDEAHEFLKEHWNDAGFVEDYVTHLWDIPKNRKAEVVNYFATRNPFMKKRSIPTLEDGIKLGLKPKTTNIAELLRVYDEYKIKTAFNMKFANELKTVTDVDGNPLMMRSDKAPADWVTIDEPALNRVMMIGKVEKPSIKQKHTWERASEKVILRVGSSDPNVIADFYKNKYNLRGDVEIKYDPDLLSTGKTQRVAEVTTFQSKQSGKFKHVISVDSGWKGGKALPGILRHEIEHIKDMESGYFEKTPHHKYYKDFDKEYASVDIKKEDIPLLMKVPVKVNPEIAREIKTIFDKPFSHAAITAFETVNAFTKKTMLTLSLFHHFALTESAFSTGIGRKAIKQWNPFKIVKELKNKNYEIFQKMPLAKDAIEHGVTFGALSDIQRGRIQKSLISLERNLSDIPGLKQASKGLRKANDLWDAQLWDYYHNTLKMYAYETNVQSGMKSAQKRVRKNFNRDLTPEEITAVKREMGSFVNDSFGGQNWDLDIVLGNPKTRQMMHWILLAPDWTISVLKQGVAPVKGALLAKQVGKEVRGKALTKRSTMFWARAVLYYNLIAQSVNYYNTKQEYGEGRFTWKNPPGNKLNIFAGKNPDGTEKYIRMGKQFREVMEWGYEPIKKFGAKLSPVLREGIRQLTAHDPGSGYPTEFAELEGVENVKERLKSIAEMPLPFSLRPYVESRPTSFLFTLPAKKGMTNYKTVQLFKKALNSRNMSKVKETYIHALENNLDAQQLFKTANSLIKADMTFDNKELAQDIYKELKGLDPKAQIDALMIYQKRKILTPAVYYQLDKLFKKEQRVQMQKKAFGVKGR